MGPTPLPGASELRALLRDHDWRASPLGASDDWPRALITLIDVMLGSNQPMFIAWGPERTLLYNDAYALILAGKHPDALGNDFLKVWREIRDDLLPIVEQAYSGEPVHMDDIELRMERRGYPEEAHFSFFYAPVRDDDGQVAGLYCACTETTAQVLGARRREALLQLDDRLRDVADTADVSFTASELLGVALGAVRVGYGVMDAAAGTIAVERNWSAPGFASVAGLHHFANYGTYLDQLTQGQPVANADVETDDRTRANAAAFKALGIRAHLDVPVVENGVTVAQLFVHAASPRQWTAEEIAFVRDIAERTHAAIARRKAEAALRQSEMRFRTALEIETVGAIYFDMDGKLTDANDAFLSMAGYSREELEAGVLTWQQLTPPEWLEVSHRAFSELKTTGRTTPYEKEYIRRDGSRWWALFAAKLLPDGTGFEFVLDITGRKLEERRRQALIELSDRIRTAREPDDVAFAAAEILGATLSASRVGYATIDPDRETLHVARDWNAPGVQSLAGVLRLRDYGSFIDSLKLGEFIAIPDVREDLRTRTAAEALERQSARSFVNVPIVERGRLSAVLYVNHSDVRAWSGEELGLIRDMAERTLTAVQRLRAEADLRASERRLRELNDTLEDQVAARSAERDRLWNLSQDMLARADYSGMMSAVSPAWTQVLGWSEAELLARPYASFMHPEDMPPTIEAIGRMSESGRPTRFENRIATAAGGWKHIEWTVAPEADGANFVAVGRDLSEARAREAELAQAQEALRQSQKMEAMGSLTGGVAHDFNNLLTPIIGALDMLLRNGVGEDRERRLIDGALQSAERAKTLVQRLLAFARRQPLQATSVDLASLMDGVTTLIGSTLGPGVALRVEVQEGLPPAQADANQLEMALLNLAVNAKDAMPDGGELTIRAELESLQDPRRIGLTEAQYLRLSVRDTGHGMDEATRRHAIEPFFSTKGIGKGTGLGLSMVHGLASQLGGALTIDSALGKGTVVILWLPVSREPVSTGVQASAAALSIRALGKALLVDDEDLVRMSTADMLMELGYEVYEAVSASEALRLIDDGLQPDLLVTDHVMPGMTGVDLAHQLRARWPRLAILIVSGYADAESIEPSLPRLTKPFRNADLAAHLAALEVGRIHLGQ